MSSEIARVAPPSHATPAEAEGHGADCLSPTDVDTGTLCTLASVDNLDLRTVEREITTLAGHLAAATCRFLELLAAFDTGGGWHGTGIKTCAQWLSWRCGLSPATARDQLRVAHALTELPAVRGAFSRGEISYSKARALSRVATAGTEENLVSIATACTASQLDRLCSGLARARSNIEVLDQAARARFSATWENDGMLRFSGRLPAEDGAVLLAALAEIRSSAIIDSVGNAEPAADGVNGGIDRPEVIGVTADRSRDGNVSAETPDSVDNPRLPGDQFRDAGALAARGDAAALVVLARHALSSPPPESGSAGPVRLVVHTTGQALAMSTAAGPADAPQMMLGAASAEALDQGTPVPTVAVLDAGPAIPLVPLGPDTLLRLACEALVEPSTHPDDDQPARTVNRFATTRQRRALLRRDGGCAFPGCPRRRHLHAHHRRPWAEGGSTTIDNLVLACSHHHKLVHEGGWQLDAEIDARGHRTWVATGPDGRRHTTAPATSGRAGDLPSTHTAAITPGIVAGHWAGEPLDLGYAVSVLSQPGCVTPSSVAC